MIDSSPPPIALDLCGGSLSWCEHIAGVTYVMSQEAKEKRDKDWCPFKGTPTLYKTRSHYVAQTEFELALLLSLPPEILDYRRLQ